MENKTKTNIEKEMESSQYRELYGEEFASVNIEVQILNILEEKKWSFARLAKEMGTNQSNISRDLSSGRINSATVSRLSKMATALGVVFLPLFVAKDVAENIVSTLSQTPKLEDWRNVCGGGHARSGKPVGRITR